uniref:Uncharacterized protein LOC104211107 n=1 Tax=Nicotiana sylvestris TaxID=4096 RepID=A0A1U7V9B7_NICSY|nr:PREDICTED: uncharacterized protein LOC104211107 [Nicotiana sylvestris]
MFEVAGSTIEDLDPVQTDLNDHNKNAYIGCKLLEPGKFCRFLATNVDLFAFSHAEMPSIPKEISMHKLNIDTFHPPVRQVRRKVNSVTNDAVREEVEKLLESGSIRESKYPPVGRHCGHGKTIRMENGEYYNQILMEEEDQEKTTFIIHQGTYYYRVMPFGLKNAGENYQRLVTRMFKDQLSKTMEV